MNIKELLKEKKEYLQKLVNTHSNLQKQLNDSNTEIVRTDGAIRVLQELITKEKQ